MLFLSWWLRYQRKEAKIQEWENCQKSKFEAKMRNAEVSLLLTIAQFHLNF
jgi:hypothetical protein